MRNQIIGQIEAIITNNFFDNSIFKKFEDLQENPEINSKILIEKVIFWSSISRLFEEVEKVSEDRYESLIDYKKSIKTKKGWNLEKNFLNEKLFTFENYSKERNKKLNEITLVINYYDEEKFYLRKHQALYTLALYYIRNNNEKLTYFTLIKLLRSFEQNGGEYREEWFLPFFNNLQNFLNLDLLDSLIRVAPDLFNNPNIKLISSNFLKESVQKKPFESYFQIAAFLNINPDLIEPHFQAFFDPLASEEVNNYIKFILAPEIRQAYNIDQYLSDYYDFFLNLKIFRDQNIFEIIKNFDDNTKNVIGSKLLELGEIN